VPFGRATTVRDGEDGVVEGRLFAGSWFERRNHTTLPTPAAIHQKLVDESDDSDALVVVPPPSPPPPPLDPPPDGMS